MMPAPRPWLKYYDPEIPPHIDYPCIPVYRLLDDTTARNPAAPCTRFFGKRLTYGAIKDLSDRLAAALRRLGVRKGDRVALLLPNCPQYLASYYGAMKAGAVVVPLNPLSTTRELTFYFGDAAAETVITIPLFLGKVADLPGATPLKRIICTRMSDFLPFPLNLAQGFQERKMIGAVKGKASLIDFKALIANPAPADFHPEPADEQEMAALLYSGGTTGIAKGIMLSHYNLVSNAHQIRAWGHCNDQDRILTVLPLFHGYAMSANMNTQILAGSEIILVPRFNAKQVAEIIHKTRPTFFTGVPTMFVALSNLPDIGRYDLKSVQGTFVGAAPLTHAIKDDFEAKTGGRMIEGYGLTEAVTAIMANPYHGTHKVGSIGIPFSDVDMKIVSLDDGQEMPVGQQGEIVLKSPTVMLGYYKKPEETADTIVDGWLHTGDIGYQDEDGYFYITDRKKDLIIVGGFNVFPREIDELLYQHPKVKEGITVGIPDAYKGERIKCYVVLKDGETATPEEIVAYMRQNLVPYKVPSEIEFRADLPKNAIGKILRRSLREEEMGRGGK